MLPSRGALARPLAAVPTAPDYSTLRSGCHLSLSLHSFFPRSGKLLLITKVFREKKEQTQTKTEHTFSGEREANTSDTEAEHSYISNMQTRYPTDSLRTYLALWALEAVTPGLDPFWDSDLPAESYSACVGKRGKGHLGNHRKLGLALQRPGPMS